MTYPKLLTLEIDLQAALPLAKTWKINHPLLRNLNIQGT